MTNTLLRRSLRATRTLAGAASWAVTRMLGAQRPDNGFTIQVKTHGGQCFSLDVARPAGPHPALTSIRACECLAPAT